MDPITITREDGCRLQVVASLEEGQLRLTYRFANGSTKTGYLFNRVYHEVDQGRRQYVIGKDLVFVSVAGEVTVAKRIPELPANTAVEVRVVPCLTRVAAGGRFEETIQLALPLRPMPGYGEPPKQLASARERPLVFELGYFLLATPANEKLIRMVKTSQGEAPRVYPFPAGSQALFRAALPLKVPAQEGTA